MILAVNTFGMGALLKAPFLETIQVLKENGVSGLEPCIHFKSRPVGMDLLIAIGMKTTDRMGGVWTGADAKEKIALLRSVGFHVEGAHLFSRGLTKKIVQEALAFAKENDLKYYAMSYMSDQLEWAKKQVPLLRYAAETFRAEGVHLLLHNHDVDLRETNGQCVLDLLLDSVPELELELDVGWAAYGGKDCLVTIEKYKDRLRILHFKDMSAVRTDALKKAPFCAVGEGIIPLTDIVKQVPQLDLFPAGMVIDQDDSEGDMLADILTGAANIRAAEAIDATAGRKED